MFGEEVPKEVTAPAAKHLLGINENSIQLYKARRKVLKYVTAKVSYIMKREQLKLKPTVAL